MRQSFLSFGLVVTGIIAGCTPENRNAAPNPVKWTVADTTAQLHAAAATTLRLTAAIDSGWYIYSLTQKSGGPTPMTISLAPSPPFRVEGSVSGPKPVVIFDKEFGIETERYEGKPAFAIPVALTATQSAQPKTLDVKVRYQACNESFCLPARTTVLSTPVRVEDRP
jgi:DsbC/DsbD-like thiol-disulfide interchange protein